MRAVQSALGEFELEFEETFVRWFESIEQRVLSDALFQGQLFLSFFGFTIVITFASLALCEPFF